MHTCIGLGVKINNVLNYPRILNYPNISGGWVFCQQVYVLLEYFCHRCICIRVVQHNNGFHLSKKILLSKYFYDSAGPGTDNGGPTVLQSSCGI